jgi:flagellar protein FliS
MNPYRTYRRPEPSTGWTRIDVLLALFDGALDRLDRADRALQSGDRAAALGALVKSQLIVAELAAGVRREGNDAVGPNLLRLYEFVSHQLREPARDRIAAARRVLVMLREGFQAVRTEAVELERNGLVPAAEVPLLMTTA